MAVQTFGLSAARIAKFKGEILTRHPDGSPRKGRPSSQMPKNSSDTYVARRWVPYGAAATYGTNGAGPNQFFANAAGDRSATMAAAHLTTEGVTVSPDSIVPQDITVVVQQYSCLYGFTDKTYDLYEDDIPAAMKEQVGERVALVNEQIVYGALKATTNKWYGGTGSSVSTVNGKLTLNLLRKVAKSLQANHGKPVTSVLKASGNYGTDAVAPGYIVYAHTDLEPDVRDLPGFIPAEKYASGTPMPNEIGKVERFRFITSPDLPSVQNGASTITASTYGLYTTGGTNPDVYQLIVTAADAWSQIAVRGKESLDPTFLPPGQKSKSDPHGQRGYAGTIWYKAVLLENDGWIACVNVGATSL